MGKKNGKKQQLMSSAPWRGEESEEFKDAKVKVTSQPDGTSTMHVPRSNHSNLHHDDSLDIDPQLRYSFQRNFQFLQRVFTIDTLVKPLPPAMAYNVSRNLNFFTRIFTQFFDPEGIANAQKSLGIGQEDKVRKVR
ncbi:hypothetical protein TanjilG_17517 [Lupinus angustifolius]|uniref:Uncharacterized protein n=1 Tax=Lupinus angustifolius TaxID=3871 RepID=A0A4P1R1P9_LUPAN|nr:PREDICTED: uncharacterized protein LOC109324986 [Lupinus angustifolius]XP_019412668.1 PREDICTED: uncharacterized protein LOC109324986 [Lupinus angustifolius]XP_019412669.1 PREDICTED: uncharacterized protein LOC109324986 [Lupinus angustifolius]OIV99707.1 hypothetical protein TanjilG_17517 [Lupinus angustifolius]